MSDNNSLIFHEYLNNGLYDVTLIAENIATGCVDTMYRPDYIYCSGGVSNPCDLDSLELTISTTDPTACGLQDGTATVNVSGGTPTFSYLWSNELEGSFSSSTNGLSSGTYSVLVTDSNECTQIGTFVINELNTIELSITA